MINKTTIYTLLLLILLFTRCKSTEVNQKNPVGWHIKALVEKINENPNLQGTVYVIGFEDALNHNVYYAFNKNKNQYYRYDLIYDEKEKKFYLAPKTNISTEVVKRINEIRNNDYTYQEDNHCDDCMMIVLYVFDKKKNEETRYQNEKIISKAYLGVYR